MQHPRHFHLAFGKPEAPGLNPSQLSTFAFSRERNITLHAWLGALVSVLGLVEQSMGALTPLSFPRPAQ